MFILSSILILCSTWFYLFNQINLFIYFNKIKVIFSLFHKNQYILALYSVVLYFSLYELSIYEFCLGLPTWLWGLEISFLNFSFRCFLKLCCLLILASLPFLLSPNLTCYVTTWQHLENFQACNSSGMAIFFLSFPLYMWASGDK